LESNLLKVNDNLSKLTSEGKFDGSGSSVGSWSRLMAKTLRNFRVGKIKIKIMHLFYDLHEELQSSCLEKPP
jgi:hypothetical protein